MGRSGVVFLVAFWSRFLLIGAMFWVDLGVMFWARFWRVVGLPVEIVFKIMQRWALKIIRV